MADQRSTSQERPDSEHKDRNLNIWNAIELPIRALVERALPDDVFRDDDTLLRLEPNHLVQKGVDGVDAATFLGQVSKIARLAGGEHEQDDDVERAILQLARAASDSTTLGDIATATESRKLEIGLEKGMIKMVSLPRMFARSHVQMKRYENEIQYGIMRLCSEHQADAQEDWIITMKDEKKMDELLRAPGRIVKVPESDLDIIQLNEKNQAEDAWRRIEEMLDTDEDDIFSADSDTTPPPQVTLGTEYTSKGKKRKDDRFDIVSHWNNGVNLLAIELTKGTTLDRLLQTFRYAMHPRSKDGRECLNGKRVESFVMLIRGARSYTIAHMSLVQGVYQVDVTPTYKMTCGAFCMADAFLSLIQSSPASLGWYEHPPGYTLTGCVGMGGESVVFQAKVERVGSDEEIKVDEEEKESVKALDRYACIKYYRDERGFAAAKRGYKNLKDICGFTYDNASSHCFDCPRSIDEERMSMAFDFYLYSPPHIHPSKWRVLIDQLSDFHDHGLMHCDLSLSNILLDHRRACLRITDCGGVKRFHEKPRDVSISIHHLYKPEHAPDCKKWDQTYLLSAVEVSLGLKKIKTTADFHPLTRCREDLSRKEFRKRFNKLRKKLLYSAPRVLEAPSFKYVRSTSLLASWDDVDEEMATVEEMDEDDEGDEDDDVVTRKRMRSEEPSKRKRRRFVSS